ncbi:efflux RND transporter periplasmic adaptor subunit [Sphingobacterium thalpophilum]|uniref:Efflux RND transporter periplasmic adaptor subunit n=1 Tax=Sphingobacterium thalpophilum TaxID=259 RepID=A0A4U9VXW2_9SPHI|nr:MULTISPECIES: efflux RND transporter periplasmic adaptor subunit [Sphingobacterium]MCW8311818.1 efflux RND transporter periplasmic adaptor subunit [Sphingobacterium sp. InxBP1]VTR52515.1 Macrolide-specific efflux protein macA precursor [Sphingobacterium thalpophilum]
MAKKKRSVIKIIFITLALLAIVVFIGFKAGWFGNGEVTKVAVDVVKEMEVDELVSASGKIQPEIEVKLSSEVSGEVVELTIKEGDFVKKGQVLCRIKPDILQSGYDRSVAALNSQRANLAAAQQQLKQQEENFKNIEATFKRNQELFQKRVISAAEMDKSSSEYYSTLAAIQAQRETVRSTRYGIEQSQASVKEAQDNLNRTTIYAPTDGIISLLSIEQGERVVGTAQMAGTEIMRIANMSSMEVNVDVNENDINNVRVGNQAEIEVDAFQDRKFKGVVTEIASSSKNIATTTAATSSTDQVTNFNVKVRISPESYQDLMKENIASPFKPGLSATVQIFTKHDKGMVVPIQSVTVRSDDKDSTTVNKKIQEFVFVLKGDTVKQTLVKTGIQDDKNIIVLSGLKKGDEVVSRPFDAISKTLKNGSKVQKVDKSVL